MVYGTATETCRAICPYSKTKIFFGSEIRSATAKDGQRYADLETAFVYRKELVANCTCNGRDAFCLAQLSVNNDPTLRAGDIVSTANGLLAFAGKSAQGAIFTPVNPTMLPANIRPGSFPLPVPPSTEPPPEDEPGAIALRDKAIAQPEKRWPQNVTLAGMMLNGRDGSCPPEEALNCDGLVESSRAGL
jgi:uncharacterized protein DUF2865